MIVEKSLLVNMVASFNSGNNHWCMIKHWKFNIEKANKSKISSTTKKIKQKMLHLKSIVLINNLCFPYACAKSHILVIM